MTLREALVAAAEEVGADVRAADDQATEFRRGGRIFATAVANVVEVKLDSEIAEAALRTPSTSAAGRGGDWVRLSVGEPTQMDVDRARAWFLSAWRAAEE